MSRAHKILLGFFTFLPLVFFVYYFARFLYFFFGLPFGDTTYMEEHPREFLGDVFGLIGILILAICFSIGIMIYYLIHASRNPKIGESEKVIWILVLVLASTLGSIVYYFLHIIPPEETRRQKLEEDHG